MTSHMNNAAGRLHDLFTRGRAAPGKNLASGVLCDLFGIESADSATLLQTLGSVYALPREIEARVRAIPSLNHDVYLEWIPTVLNAFSQLNLGTHWAEFIKRIDEKTLYGLKICDEVLGRECADPELDQDQLAKLRAKARTLIDDVIQGEIDETLKQYLLKYLAMIERAIDDYDLQGADPIVGAVERVIGSICIQRPIAEAANATPHGKRFLEILQGLFLILSLAKVMTELPQDFASAFLPEPPTAEVSAQDAAETAESSKTSG